MINKKDTNTGYDAGDAVERRHGSIALLKISLSALHQLMVEKGLLSEDELREAFERVTHAVEEASPANADNKNLYNGEIVAFDCRDKSVTIQCDEMPSGKPGHRLGQRISIIFRDGV